MSSSAAKAAYQRRHNLVARGGAKDAETVEPEPVAPPPPPKGEMTSNGPSATWAQKRKEHVLARSGGGRRPSDAEIAPPPAAAAVAKKASATTEKSWQEKRKDNFLTRSMGVRPPPRKADVAVSAVVFVAKLKRLSLGRTPSPQLKPAPPLQLRPGSIYELSEGEHAGAPGRLVAKVAAMDPADGELAFMRLEGGGRAIVPAMQLRPWTGPEPRGIKEGGLAPMNPALLLSPLSQHPPSVAAPPAASSVPAHDEKPRGELMNAVQRKRGRKRRAERRSRELREGLLHVPEPQHA